MLLDASIWCVALDNVITELRSGYSDLAGWVRIIMERSGLKWRRLMNIIAYYSDLLKVTSSAWKAIV